MARRAPDAIDLLCHEWAKQWRRVNNVDDPKMEKAFAREFMGYPRCTLGQRRDLHAGATSKGRVEQHFPEVFEGDGLHVQQVFRRMRPAWQTMLMAHYVIRGYDIHEKADALAMTPPTYYKHLDYAKGMVEGYTLNIRATDPWNMP